MVFFDIDETLMDHHAAQRVAALSFLNDHKELFPYSEKEFACLWHQLAQTYFDRYVSGDLSYQEQRRLRMKKLFQSVGIDLTDSQADEKLAEFLDQYESNWKVFDDVVPCLNRLVEKCQLGVISNGNYERQLKKLEKTGVLSYFSIIVTSSGVGVAKPHKRIFTEACSRMNKKPNECWYVGDQLVTDAIGSHRAGMRGIWLNRHQVDVEEAVPKAIRVIDTLEALT